MRVTDALKSLITRIDRLSSEAVVDEDSSILEKLLFDAPIGKIDMCMSNTGKLVSFVKEMSYRLGTPEDPKEITYEFPPELYCRVDSLIKEIIGDIGKTHTELLIIQNIILFNIAKNKIYTNEDGQPIDPYASRFFLYIIDFLASDDCKDAASSINACIQKANIHSLIENIESLNVLVSQIQSYCYVKEVLRIAKSKMHIIPSPNPIPLDAWTDNWLGKAAQIVCIEVDKSPRILEMVSNIFRYMLTCDMKVTTNHDFEECYYVYETDTYMDKALQATKTAKLEMK